MPSSVLITDAMSDRLGGVVPVPSDVVKMTGPYFIAYMLNWGLFGALALQTYQYYIDFPEDRWSTKTIVYTSFVLETIQTLALTSSGYALFGYGFGDMKALDTITFGWVVVPITTGIVAFLAQGFYAYRISVLSESHKLTYLIGFLSAMQLTASMVVAARLYHVGHWSRFMDPTVFILAAFWEGANALCDIVISGCMIYFVRRRSTGVRRTRMILARVVNLTMGTGAVTAIAAMVTLITTYVPSAILLYQVTGTNLGKLYSVSMLVVLNERMKNRTFVDEAPSISRLVDNVFPIQSCTTRSTCVSGHSGSQPTAPVQAIRQDVESGVRVYRETLVLPESNQTEEQLHKQDSDSRRNSFKGNLEALQQ